MGIPRFNKDDIAVYVGVSGEAVENDFDDGEGWNIWT